MLVGLKVAVVGGRDFNDYEKMKKILDEIGPDVIVSGGANGADKLAEKMNEGISPYFWYVGKVSKDVVFNEISRKVDYAVCLEKMI